MMKKRNMPVILLDEDRRRYLLEKPCQFEEAVYNNEKNKQQLEKVALAIICGKFPEIFIIAQVMSMEDFIKKVCEESVELIKNRLRNISCIRQYLRSDFVKNEDEDSLLEDIARFIIED